MRATVTLAVRKRSSGYRLFACSVDSMDHAYALANLIARSPEYSRCFVTALDQFGDELFSVGLSAPVAAVPTTPHATSSPRRALPTIQAGQHDSYVVDAEIIPSAPRLPPRTY